MRASSLAQKPCSMRVWAVLQTTRAPSGRSQASFLSTNTIRRGHTVNCQALVRKDRTPKGSNGLKGWRSGHSSLEAQGRGTPGIRRGHVCTQWHGRNSARASGAEWLTDQEQVEMAEVTNKTRRKRLSTDTRKTEQNALYRRGHVTASATSERTRSERTTLGWAGDPPQDAAERMTNGGRMRTMRRGKRWPEREALD